MPNQTDALQRFITAQQPVFSQVQNELINGKKMSHWMWYIFPQIRGLGISSTSQYYAIQHLAEAHEYLEHPILGQRLIECCQLILDHTDKTAEQIFGSIDSVKLKSSMTLFSQALLKFSQTAPKYAVFEQVLQQFFDGQKDEKTLSLLN